MELDGRVAIVTGAGKRLGRAIALALGRAGADVVVHYGGSAEAAESVAETLRASGRRAWPLQADLADTAAIERLFEAAGEAAGRIDVLVNSAARFDSAPFEEMDAEAFDRVLAVNLRAPFLCMRHAARWMRRGEEPGGVIINLADLSGVAPWLGYAVHGASKAGLLLLTQAAARELGPQVRVNAVIPGAILPHPGADPESDAWKRRGEELPLQRTGAPENVTRAVLHLIENDFVTGAVLPVDGGERLLGLAGR